MTATASKSVVDRKRGDSEVAGTPRIGAPRPSYAVDSEPNVPETGPSARPSAGQTALRLEPLNQRIRSRKGVHSPGQFWTAIAGQRWMNVDNREHFGAVRGAVFTIADCRSISWGRESAAATDTDRRRAAADHSIVKCSSPLNRTVPTRGMSRSEPGAAWGISKKGSPGSACRSRSSCSAPQWRQWLA